MNLFRTICHASVMRGEALRMDPTTKLVRHLTVDIEVAKQSVVSREAALIAFSQALKNVYPERPALLGFPVTQNPERHLPPAQNRTSLGTCGAPRND
jgi:hypothetical protein